jgi:hypothetical protein
MIKKHRAGAARDVRFPGIPRAPQAGPGCGRRDALHLAVGARQYRMLGQRLPAVAVRVAGASLKLRLRKRWHERKFAKLQHRVPRQAVRPGVELGVVANG